MLSSFSAIFGNNWKALSDEQTVLFANMSISKDTYDEILKEYTSSSFCHTKGWFSPLMLELKKLDSLPNQDVGKITMLQIYQAIIDSNDQVARRLELFNLFFNEKKEAKNGSERVLLALLNAIRDSFMKETLPLVKEQEVGHGGFAKVYKTTFSRFTRGVNQNSYHYAFKILNFSSCEKENKEKADKFQEEVKRLCQLDHENIVEVYGHLVSPSDSSVPPVMIMERADYDLSIFIKKNADDVKLRLSCFLDIFAQIISALDYLHRKDITHGDIKPDNILVFENDDQRIVKLADFGLSTSTSFQGGFGTIPYMAPEFFQTGSFKYNKVDIYAFAIMALKFLSISKYAKSSSIYFSIYQEVKKMIMAEKTEAEKTEAEKTEDEKKKEKEKECKARIKEIYNQRIIAQVVNRYRCDQKVLAIAGEGHKIPPEILEKIEDCLAHKPHERPSASDLFSFFEEKNKKTVNEPNPVAVLSS